MNIRSNECFFSGKNSISELIKCTLNLLRNFNLAFRSIPIDRSIPIINSTFSAIFSINNPVPQPISRTFDVEFNSNHFPAHRYFDICS